MSVKTNPSSDDITNTFQIINKVEKENFGLKLKIHFLEESLRKTGPGFNEAALKENTDLKVDRITLQKELSRCKKMLSQAERDVEALRRHVEEVQLKAKHRSDDEKVQIELETLRQTLMERETQVEELRIQTEAAEGHADEVDKLKAIIEDLEVDLREKDRQIDERDDEIDKVKEQEKKDAAELDEAEAELDEARKRLEELELDVGKIAEAADKLEEAQAELQEALESKERAEADLEDLRDEMSNKSINTKGLSRQLEEKVNKLQDELTDTREKHAQLQTVHGDLEERSRAVERKEREFQDHKQDAGVGDRKLKEQNEVLRGEQESLAQKCQNLNDQLQRAIEDLQAKSEEKDLLHSRHDALTSESQQLQKDLVRAQALVAELEHSLADEKEHAEDNDRQLRSEAQNEIQRLSTEVEGLHRDVERTDTQSASKEDLWKSERRSLETQKEKAEEKALGLQRTINKLQETEGTLSSREMQLQEALESERQRHENEEAVLERRAQDMTAEIEEKRQTLADLRSSLSESNDDLRISQRDQADLEEKIQALEDEVEVLQTGLDEESEKAKEDLDALEQEVVLLRSQLDAANAHLSPDQDDAASANQNELEGRLQAAERKLSALQSEKQLLQRRLTTSDQDMQKLRISITEVEIERDELRNGRDDGAELSILREHLSASRKKETDLLQRETAQKSLVRDLKQRIARLESQVHEAEMASGAVDSPKSSDNGSARKIELIEVRRQLTETQQQLRDSRTKSKGDLKAIQERLLASERQSQDTLSAYEQLEADLARAQHEQTSLQAANTASSATINRLRTRISSLETHRARLQGTVADDTIAEERKDLHDLLKDSKLQAEDLQLQVVSREATIAATATREKNLQAQLKRAREERSLQTQQSSALVTELDDLQMRYEHAIERFSRQQRSWEDERKSIASRVRFPNTSFSESHANDEELEKRHVGELKGLAKQIQWLRAKLHREGTFREGLVYEKKWLLLRIEMFEAW